MVSILGGYQEGEEVGLLNRLHLRLHHRILGDVVKPTKGEERASPEDDDEDAEDQLHRKSEEMWRSHRRRRDVSTGVDHKMGKDVPALKIDGGDARTMR